MKTFGEWFKEKYKQDYSNLSDDEMITMLKSWSLSLTNEKHYGECVGYAGDCTICKFQMFLDQYYKEEIINENI